MNRAYGSFLIGFDCSNGLKIRCYKMYRADGSLQRKSSVGTINCSNGFLIRCYKMCRADGSMKRNNSVGMYHIVATDFNPLVDKLEEMLSSIGTT